MPNDTQNLPAFNYFTPVELVGIYRNFLQRRGENNVIWLSAHRNRPYCVKDNDPSTKRHKHICGHC